MLRCSLRDPITGLLCRTSFRRAWNLKRHMLTQHRPAPTSVERDESLQPPAQHYAVIDHEQLNSVTPLQGLGRHLVVSNAGSGESTVRRQSILDEAAPSEVITPNAMQQYSGGPSPDPDALACLPPLAEGSESSLKRKRSTGGYDRVAVSRSAPPMPVYEVKMSTKDPEQPRAHEWRSKLAKKTFDMELDYRLAQWGVNKSHQGTCVLVPEDWRSLDPMTLMGLFDLENCPSAQAPRLRYQYDDHCTAFARALAWFSTWPRSGLNLDNFVGGGEHAPMDASHICHHDSCIVHVTYEPAHINHDRKACCQKSRRMRGEGKEVPEHCREHSPPCLLQVS
ncbi:MAG: hypothetical protein Q9170_002199 [Blastenia crenularia]